MLRRVLLILLFVVPRLAAAAPDARQVAEELLADGAKAFHTGDFQTAIDEFKKSYASYPNPIALYNIAQVYRQMKDNDKAIFFYQQYLTEAPGAPDRAKIKARIVELKELAAQRKAVPEKPPEGGKPGPASKPPVGSPPVVNSPAPPQAAPLVATPAAAPPRSPSEGRPLYAWLLAGGGLAVTAAGLGIVVSASGLDDDALRAGTASDALVLRDQASSRRELGTAVTIGGGLVAAAGIVLLVWNPGHASALEGRETALEIGPRSITLRGTF